jgi:5-methylcytosine-specific restriction endonuclease McrA
MTVQLSVEKVCSGCKETLDISCFHKDKRGALGRVSRCKGCVHERIKAYYAANRERKLAEALQWSRDNKDKSNAAKVRYRIANAAKCRAASDKWKAEHKDRVLITKRVRQSVRRARKRASAGAYAAADVERLKVMQRGLCAICHEALTNKFHVDHIQPLSKGGDNSRFNIQLTCKNCNMTKTDSDPIHFMQSRGMLL